METPDLLDKSISIAILFFVLSLISERFINWFKLYFLKKGNTLLGLFNWEIDYINVENNPSLEKEKERLVLGINISLSIIIAFILHVDFIEILKSDNPYNSLGWKIPELTGFWNYFLYYLNTIIGCIISGLFMSLGSKFWHDTLDLLYVTKRLKQKAKDPDTYNVNNTKELDEYISLTSYELITSAFEKEKDSIKQVKGVNGIGIEKYDNKNNYFIAVQVDNFDTLEKIPKYVDYKLSSGKVIKFPIQVKVSKMAEIQLAPAKSVANINKKENFGSISCFVEDEKQDTYLLTCYHCVIEPGNLSFTFNKDKIIEVCAPHTSETIIAPIANGIRNSFVDAAIIGPLNNLDISNVVENYGSINNALNIAQVDKNALINSQVLIRGSKTGKTVSGQIKGIYYDKIFNYGTNDSPSPHELLSLIGISEDGKKVTTGGDSGAPVLDLRGNIIGIVVGSIDMMTFAIPIFRIFKYLNIEFKKFYN